MSDTGNPIKTNLISQYFTYDCVFLMFSIQRTIGAKYHKIQIGIGKKLLEICLIFRLQFANIASRMLHSIDSDSFRQMDIYSLNRKASTYSKDAKDFRNSTFNFNSLKSQTIFLNFTEFSIYLKVNSLSNWKTLLCLLFQCQRAIFNQCRIIFNISINKIEFFVM